MTAGTTALATTQHTLFYLAEYLWLSLCHLNIWCDVNTGSDESVYFQREEREINPENKNLENAYISLRMENYSWEGNIIV